MVVAPGVMVDDDDDDGCGPNEPSVEMGEEENGKESSVREEPPLCV
jgi:hypothetical protein